MKTLSSFVIALCAAAPVCLAQSTPNNFPATLSRGALCGSCDEPKELSWKTVIPSEKDGSEPLVITGRIFRSDGKTPAEGMILFVHHTERTGYYNSPNEFPFQVKGWMRI